MYKHNHVYFDPNIWYLDEELRKQVETFARAFIMTGQEAPESSKKLHIDLYKKTISADGIMGRKPYGYSTKMFHTIGWTRLEVNRIMKFLGVGNNAFNSMFRRSLVWKAKARFIHKKFLAACFGWMGLGWAGLGWAGRWALGAGRWALGWAGLGWAGLGWAGLGLVGPGWGGLGLGWASWAGWLGQLGGLGGLGWQARLRGLRGWGLESRMHAVTAYNFYLSCLEGLGFGGLGV